MILSVGFRHGKTLDIPVTLYSGDVRKLTKPTNKVLAIFRRTFPEKTYVETTYVSKDTNISEIALGEGAFVIDIDEETTIKPERK